MSPYGSPVTHKGRDTRWIMAHSKTAKHPAVRWPIETKDAQSKAADKSPTAKEKVAGRVSHDERGNAVFKRRTGDSTSTMLRRLEVPGLELADQENAPAPLKVANSGGKVKPASRPEPGGGYNPYDQSKAVKKPTTPKGPVGRRTR